MGTAQGALDIFRSWLAQGIHEVPAGSNRTPIGVEFGWNGVAWCAEAISLALSKSGTPGYHTASVYALQAQLKREGRWSSTPHVGSLAIYSSLTYPNGGAHVNMIESISGGSMICIGGNESDAVRRSVRSISSAYGFGLPPYSGAPAPQPGPAPAPAPAPVPIPVPAPRKRVSPMFIFRLDGHPHTFICNLVSARWHTDPEDHNISVWELAVAGLPHNVTVLSKAQANKYPVTNINADLQSLGFRSV